MGVYEQKRLGRRDLENGKKQEEGMGNRGEREGYIRII
jgi:hypothetical protein